MIPVSDLTEDQLRRIFLTSHPFTLNLAPSANDPDDPALILRIDAGDDEAFEILYHRHRDWIFRMAHRLTGEPHLANDVLQEVFCYFLGKFPGFILRCNLRTFFYPVVRNLSLNLLKKARRYDGGQLAEAHLQNLIAPRQHVEDESSISAIIAGLSTDHREVLLLRFVDGMTVPEIAALTEIPLGTVKSRLHHALAALRDTPIVQEISGKSERSTLTKCLTPRSS